MRATPTSIMGCCSSIPGVPDVIIPDPVGPPCVFYCKPSGAFSSNMTVLQGNKDGPTWLFLRKRGKMFKDDINIVLENFIRTDPEHPDEGKALCVCKFDSLDSQAYKFYGGSFDSWQDSDNSDGYSADEGDFSSVDVDKQSGKFMFVTKSKFFSDRAMKTKIAEIKVKAKGKVKRTVRWTKRDITDAQTQAVTGHEWISQVHSEVKVKKLIYKFVTIDAASGAECEVPITLHGSLNSSAASNKWESPMFQVCPIPPPPPPLSPLKPNPPPHLHLQCQIQGGFFSSDKPIITTQEAPNFTHALSLLAGYVCSIELSPEDVRSNCNPPWPQVNPPEPNSNGQMPWV